MSESDKWTPGEWTYDIDEHGRGRRAVSAQDEREAVMPMEIYRIESRVSRGKWDAEAWYYDIREAKAVAKKAAKDTGKAHRVLRVGDPDVIACFKGTAGGAS